jgi:hypothetical protein
MCDSRQRPRSQDGPSPIEQERDGERVLERDRVERTDPLEEALRRAAGAQENVLTMVDHLSPVLERRGAPAESWSGFEHNDRMPVAGEPAGGGHAREAASDNYDARH